MNTFDPNVPLEVNFIKLLFRATQLKLQKTFHPNIT